MKTIHRQVVQQFAQSGIAHTAGLFLVSLFVRSVVHMYGGMSHAACKLVYICTSTPTILPEHKSIKCMHIPDQENYFKVDFTT